MSAVRCGPGLLMILLTGCALPPRVDDQSTPTGAYETFRGALARGEHEREFDCLSDGLRAQLGLRSRIDWKNARVIVLKQSHLAIKAISGSEIVGEPEPLPDGRVRLKLRLRVLVFSKEGTLWMRPVPRVRVWVDGIETPIFDQLLPNLEIVREKGVLGVRMPPALLSQLEFEPGERGRRLDAGIAWFLDEFDTGDQTASSVREELEQQK